MKKARKKRKAKLKPGTKVIGIVNLNYVQVHVPGDQVALVAEVIAQQILSDSYFRKNYQNIGDDNI